MIHSRHFLEGILSGTLLQSAYLLAVEVHPDIHRVHQCPLPRATNGTHVPRISSAECPISTVSPIELCYLGGRRCDEQQPDNNTTAPFCLVLFDTPGAIHQQRDPHPRVSHRAGAGAGVAHGRKLSRLLIGRFPGSPQARCCSGRSRRRLSYLEFGGARASEAGSARAVGRRSGAAVDIDSTELGTTSRSPKRLTPCLEVNRPP